MPSLDVITNAFCPRNIHWSSRFARKTRVNTERVPPGHPIILLKSNKFNMAAVSVKRSIIDCLQTGHSIKPLKVCKIVNHKVYWQKQGVGHWKQLSAVLVNSTPLSLMHGRLACFDVGNTLSEKSRSKITQERIVFSVMTSFLQTKWH